ncbi:MAG: Eco29kI family restriction endonuclease [Verrucomicrobiales bacterium]|nr:Eco29kI family restriction endonuclease [Verrucomicrobiales bacterium]
MAASIVSKLLNQDAQELPPPTFPGAGLYLLYYTGPFEAYQKISEPNQQSRFRQPIYVGKAIPKGGRKGLEGFDVPHGEALSRRLKEHADSINAARNLELADFRCRWLVVDEVFIPLGESLLISHYRPLWNAVVDGFGNHPPGKGRAKGKKPLWDVLHPGRRWADRLKAAMTADQVLALVRNHLESFTLPAGDVTP